MFRKRGATAGDKHVDPFTILSASIEEVKLSLESRMAALESRMTAMECKTQKNIQQLESYLTTSRHDDTENNDIRFSRLEERLDQPPLFQAEIKDTNSRIQRLETLLFTELDATISRLLDAHRNLEGKPLDRTPPRRTSLPPKLPVPSQMKVTFQISREAGGDQAEHKFWGTWDADGVNVVIRGTAMYVQNAMWDGYLNCSFPDPTHIVFEPYDDGMQVKGELDGEGCLKWSDGNIWTRTGTSTPEQKT